MFLPASPNVLLAALLMGLSCASLFGLNPLLTTLVPLEYDKIGRTGLTAGLIDSFIYMGSALAGVIDGGIYEKSGLNALYLTWILSGLAGTIAVYLSGTRHSIQALNDISIRGRSAYENHSR